jgi:isocitrate/isopropylmalate dehydrogenase
MTDNTHRTPTDEEVQKILDQAPEWATSMQVYELWMAHEGNIVAILSALWDVPPQKKKQQTKWDKMREICDEHDRAMEEVLRSIKR